MRLIYVKSYVIKGQETNMKLMKQHNSIFLHTLLDDLNKQGSFYILSKKECLNDPEENERILNLILMGCPLPEITVCLSGTDSYKKSLELGAMKREKQPKKLDYFNYIISDISHLIAIAPLFASKYLSNYKVDESKLKWSWTIYFDLSRGCFVSDNENVLETYIPVFDFCDPKIHAQHERMIEKVYSPDIAEEYADKLVKAYSAIMNYTINCNSLANISFKQIELFMSEINKK